MSATRWQIKFHYASADYTTAVYTETALTNITGLSGYGSMTFPVTEINEEPEVTGAILQARGTYRPSQEVRDRYNIKIYPRRYDTERDKVTDDITTLAKKAKLWVEINTAAQDGTYNAGTTTNYHTTGYVIPVTINAYSIDSASGYKTATVELLRGARS